MRVIFLILVVMALMAGCKKSPFAGPFTCKIDGEKYKPKGYNYRNNPLRAVLSGDTLFFISAYRDADLVGVTVKDLSGIKTGTYTLNSNDSQENNGRHVNFSKETRPFSTDPNFQGTLTIDRIDKDANTIRGTFQFVAFNQYLNDTVEVTDGRFNMEYETYW